MRWVIWAGLLTGMVCNSLRAQNGTYEISGAVVDHTTNQPLSRVLVQITPIQDGQWSDTGRFTSTDNEGRFAFPNLFPGKYTLLAGRQPSSMQLFQGEEGYSTAISVGPGLDSEHIVFPLPMLGAISGTILDEEGRGVKNAAVYLYWQHITSGRLETVSNGQQQTKSSGSFHFSHLQPGTYFLAVYAHPWYAGNNTVNQEFDVAYPLTYYADATDVSAASPITVAAGATVNLQMALHPVPAVHARFSGLEARTGVNVSPTISAIGPGGGRITLNANYTTINNHPELSGIAPGRYELSISAFEDGRGQTVGTKMIDLQGDSEIDLSGISTCSLNGRITFVDGTRAPNPLSLYLAQVAGNHYLQVSVDADGRFQIPALPPGRYQIGINGQNWFHFQAIDVKGGKFKDGLLEFPEGAKVQLSITAFTAQTALDGIALRNDKPVPGAMVLLLPEDPDRSDLIRRDQSDSDGSFTLRDVAPGRYRVLAIDNGHDLAYGEAAVMKSYLPLSQSITVDTGKQPPLKINVQTRAQ